MLVLQTSEEIGMTHIEQTEVSYKELVNRTPGRLLKYSTRDGSLYIKVGGIYTTSVILSGEDIPHLTEFLEEVQKLRETN